MLIYKAPTIGQFAIETLLFLQAFHTADVNAIAQFGVTAIDRIIAIAE